MYKVLTYNNISVSGLERFPRDKYEVASEIQHPDAILLRSFSLHGLAIPDSLKAVGRAGAGVNNIPVADYTQRGIPVFNAPGANANAVKELVIAGMLLASRHLCHAWEYARHLEGGDQEIHEQVEKGKKKFLGFELWGKTLGIIGLGAIGVKVANAAHALGMSVVGYDPFVTVERAWQLSSSVIQATSVDELLSMADFVSLHMPLKEDTRDAINADRIRIMKEGAILLNFSRDGIVNDEGVCAALDQGRLGVYVTDFPNNLLKNHPKVIALPHLGASTAEAEENCAIMVADQVKDFLENGNIKHAVNYPEMVMPRAEGYRLGVANANIPHMVSQISTCLADADLNILDLLNKSRGEVAYTLIDVDQEVPAECLEQIRQIEGVLSARTM